MKRSAVNSTVPSRLRMNDLGRLIPIVKVLAVETEILLTIGLFRRLHPDRLNRVECLFRNRYLVLAVDHCARAVQLRLFSHEVHADRIRDEIAMLLDVFLNRVLIKEVVVVILGRAIGRLELQDDVRASRLLLNFFDFVGAVAC